MKAFILFSEQSQYCGDEADTHVVTYTYCDFPFDAPKDKYGYNVGRSGYDATANIDLNCEDAFINRDQLRAVLVEVETPDEDLAFSDDYTGSGERMYGYPYSRWVRSVDFRKPQFTMDQVLAGEAGRVAWVREKTQAHRIKQLKRQAEGAEQQAKRCEDEAEEYASCAENYRAEAREIRAALTELTKEA